MRARARSTTNDLSTNQRYERAVAAVRALARVSRVLEAASADVSLAHYRVLAAVASGEERASLVAARLALGKPAVSAAVESLCRRGLLERLDVVADGRAVALSLTAEGALVLDRVEVEMTRRVVDLCSRTSSLSAAARLALSVQYDLRNAVHDHLQTMDLANLDRMPTGQLVSRANSDSALVQGLLSFLPIMSGNVLMMLLSLAVMIYLSPLLSLVSVIVVGPLLVAVSYRMRWRMFPATWDGQQREGDVARSSTRTSTVFGWSRRSARSARARPMVGRGRHALRLADARGAAPGALPAAACRRSRRSGRWRSSRSAAG
jgi:DNA-binding MarR family transcriptional regulator